MSADRKFSVDAPSLDRLVIRALEVSNPLLVSPLSTSPLCLMDGELVQMSTGKMIRGVDATAPNFFCIDDRGDYGVQASKRLSCIMGGGNFICSTAIFNSGLTSDSTAVMAGAVTIDAQSRWGLIAQTGTNIVMGYVLKPAAINGGRLQVYITQN